MDEPFGIYVHWPFCAAKCPYCDFNSYVRLKGVDEDRFAKAFAREMATVREWTGAHKATTVFIGGGTPSLMSPKTVESLLKSIDRYWPIVDNAEITMEANPSSVEAGRFHGYRSAGVNRLSLGVQSLNDEELKRLGRIHNVKQARFAIGLAREIFPRLSFDLIYARPHQTLQSWKHELEEAIDLAADHLSLYQLTIEEGTGFDRLYKAGKLKLPEAELSADLYDLTQEITESHGLPAYEISNHAAANAQSQHNLIYWRYQQYVGIGPGAHGRFLPVSNVDFPDRRLVTITEKIPERWLELVEKQGHGIAEEEHLTKSEQAEEMLLMGMRLTEGLDLARYEKLANHGLNQSKVADLQQQGLVEMVGNSRIRATRKGRVVLNHIISELA